jgi:hypothetical protein
MQRPFSLLANEDTTRVGLRHEPPPPPPLREKGKTPAMFRPKIPEVLAAVREAGIMYKTALRAIDECRGRSKARNVCVGLDAFRSMLTNR